MTPTQKDKVNTLRDRIYRYREEVASDLAYALEHLVVAKEAHKAVQDKRDALDALACISDAAALAIVEVTR